MSDLPPGFVLDQPTPAAGGLPPGFVLDAPTSAKPAERQGIAEKLWNTASQMAMAVPRLAQGVAEGVAGEGIPEGKASQFEGGPPRFAGRALGTGAKSVAESLWENLIKPPGKMLTGEMQPGPEAEAAARGTAMGMAGVGGWRPGMTLPGAPGYQPSTVNQVLRDTRGGGDIPGGGRVEPARPTPQQPVQGPQPPPLGGQALPPQGPSAPSPAGGTAVPGRPVPIVPPGQQPVFAGGQALPPAQPGVPPPAGATLRFAEPIPNIPPGQQPPRPAGQALPPQEPGIPAPPGGASQPSTFATAIAENNPGKVDQAVTKRYRQAVKPSREGQKNAPAIAEQDQRILTAVDQIIGNRGSLKLTDAAGQEINGALPRSLLQFSQAVDQTKKALFTKYDALAREAGDIGVQVDLAPVIAELRAIARKPEVVDLHPDLVPQAEQLARNFEARGFYTPAAAQDAIENLNKMLQAFYKNPTAETVSKGTMLAPIARTLRDELDKAIEGAGAPGYQALRHQYGALRSVEKDVAAAVQREANKLPGGLSGTLADIAAAESFIHGVITLNPAMIARAGGIRAARNAVKYLNDPNRAIERMFARRIASQSPLGPPLGAIGSYLGPAARAGAIGAGDLMSQRPSGGFPATQPPLRLPRHSVGAQ